MTRLAAMLGLLWLSTIGGETSAQSDSLTLLLPGAEYHKSGLPAHPTGAWFVLHGSADATTLESREVTVTAFRSCGDELADDQNGRVVDVPGVRSPIVIIRGSELTQGSLRTVFTDDGISGEAHRIETQWDSLPVVVRHVTDEPRGDQLGRYRIELTIGKRAFELRSDQWHGDGEWRLRWMGDLNRDGWPDLLADASYKYSAFTTRLFLSDSSTGRLAFFEAATSSRSAC